MSDLARAYAFAESLANGFVAPGKVVEWIDNVVLRAEEPAAEFIDAAMAKGDRNRLIGLLHALGAHADQTEVAQYMFRDMAEALSKEPTVAASVAHALYQMVLHRQWPHPDAEQQMYYFDDAFALARQQIHGDVDALRVELAQFLARFQRAA